jgi:hypothetical protein
MISGDGGAIWLLSGSHMLSHDNSSHLLHVTGSHAQDSP